MAVGDVLEPSTAFAFEKLTSTGAAQPLTKGTFAPTSGSEAQRALITVETGSIRYRYDGVAPTATSGMFVNAASGVPVIVLEGVNNIENFQFITSSGGTAATLNVTYERY